MLSRFFIDRPIFATVLSVVITLTGGIALYFLPIAQYPRISPASVQISINYPGASAQIVADTVAAPIEQQVNGVPGMLYMSSQMGNDGSYQLSVTFDIDVDLNTALVMVQNRVALAMPLLPTPVQSQGITVRKKTYDMLCMISFLSAVDVTLEDGTVLHGIIKKETKDDVLLRDADGNKRRILRKDIRSIDRPPDSDIRLSNYVLINVKDEILRVDGVADLSIMGQRDHAIRVWLDPQKMASRHVTAADVAEAIRAQNLPAAAGQIGSPPGGSYQTFQFPIDTLGRLATPEQFGNIIIKVGDAQTAPRPKSPSPGGGFDDSTALAGAAIGLGPRSFAGGAAAGGGADVGGGASSDPVLGTLTGVIGPIARKRAGTKIQIDNPAALVGPTPPSLSIVRLRDIARVELGALSYSTICVFDGQPSVGLFVNQLPGTNALDVGDRVKARMKELKKRFPADIDYTIEYDTTPFIRESIWEVFATLRDSVLLVALVVLFFLQDWRAMLLPMIDVPVALIGTFGVMAAMGYSLNNISMFGLVLAIGIVVDDAIVVLENIERQMAKGYDTRTATIRAMAEISGPIIAITLVLCAVFVPCAFISGITGRFFRQFAVTIAASTIISAINALTMTPSRALVIFRKDEGGRMKDEASPGSSHPSSFILHPSKEALPWWIFGLLGFVTATWIPVLFGELLHLPALAHAEDDAEMPAWQYWSLWAAYFAPGLLFGLTFGWFAIRPVNVFLGWVFRGFNAGFDRVTEAYGWTIGKGLRISAIVILAYGGLLFLTFIVFKDSPRGFVPQQDMGRLMVSVQLPDSAGLERTKEAVVQVEKIIREVPGVARSIGIGGISFVESANGSNFASFFVILDRFERRRDPELRANAIMLELRRRFAQIRDARVVVAPSSPVPGVSTSGGFRLMVQDRGGLGLPTLQDQTDKFIRKVQQQIGAEAAAVTARKGEGEKGRKGEEEKNPKENVSPSPLLPFSPSESVPQRPMLLGVNTQFRSNTPQLFMEIDRAKAESLDVSFEEVNQTLQIFLGSFNVNRFNAFGRYWQVTLQADREFRAKVEDINLLQVRNRRGQMVPLGTLVTVQEKTGPLFIRRYNLYAAAPVGGALIPGVSSGEVIAAVEELAHESLPRSMKTEWSELMFMQIKEGNSSAIMFGLAVVCVFLALAALYESWTLPLAVILVVPLCVLCSITGVLIRNRIPGQDAAVDIFVQIGLVVLVGLACKNAILVVEFAKELHGQGKPVFEATLEASRLRLRPILMTSLAFILGVMPLCVASGAGAEMRRSLGVAVFSGMVGVTAFGIFLTPVFFYVIQGVGETRFFANPIVQWTGTVLLGALLGVVFGYLLAQLGLIHAIWGPTVGACTGILGALAVRGVHKRLFV
jgi:multidrug efflux pump